LSFPPGESPDADLNLTRLASACNHFFSESQGAETQPTYCFWDPKSAPKWAIERRKFRIYDVPDDFIARVATVMMTANWHTYQVLTKRSDRLRKMLNGVLSFATYSRHIWWGVSVEDIRYGLPRIDHLRGTTAAVKFLSIEPLLEDLGLINLLNIDWVIVGGESGRGARPMQEAWVDNLFQQCHSANVPFFFKQWRCAKKEEWAQIAWSHSQ
jgi:protein gp37